MKSDLPDDVVAWVRKVYREQAEDVLDVLRPFRTFNASIATDRVVRCIVSAAGGDVSRVKKNIELAKADWRDVIVAAEYENPDVRVRDLSKPFDV